jgi:hypothetical protein
MSQSIAILNDHGQRLALNAYVLTTLGSHWTLKGSYTLTYPTYLRAIFKDIAKEFRLLEQITYEYETMISIFRLPLL